LVLLSSSNRKEWSSQIIHTDYLTSGDPMIVSPVFCQTIKGNFLFYVNISEENNHKIQYVRIKSDSKPDFTCRKDITISLNTLNPWHIDIIINNGYFYLLICCVKQQNDKKLYDLYIARSQDGCIWDISQEKRLGSFYRSTGFIRDGDIYIYYSRQNRLFSAWEIGIVRKHLNDFFEDHENCGNC
jgi:hypothetical protein